MPLGDLELGRSDGGLELLDLGQDGLLLLRRGVHDVAAALGEGAGALVSVADEAERRAVAVVLHRLPAALVAAGGGGGLDDGGLELLVQGGDGVGHLGELAAEAVARLLVLRVAHGHAVAVARALELDHERGGLVALGDRLRVVHAGLGAAQVLLDPGDVELLHELLVVLELAALLRAADHVVAEAGVAGLAVEAREDVAAADAAVVDDGAELELVRVAGGAGLAVPDDVLDLNADAVGAHGLVRLAREVRAIAVLAVVREALLADRHELDAGAAGLARVQVVAVRAVAVVDLVALDRLHGLGVAGDVEGGRLAGLLVLREARVAVTGERVPRDVEVLHPLGVLGVGELAALLAHEADALVVLGAAGRAVDDHHVTVDTHHRARGRAAVVDARLR